VKLIALVVPLGLDTFAVSAALGMTGLHRGQRLRVSLVFMAFEGAMPLVGLLLGRVISNTIGNLADVAAIVVLIGLGLFMLLSRGGDGEEEKLALLARTRGPAILGLGISISLDELAIGFTLGLLNVPLVLALVLIAAQAFLVAQIGFQIGGRVSESLREWAERLAGIVLLLLGAALAIGRVAGIEF
jgi:putative Mn2+ efflux pump MntP